MGPFCEGWQREDVTAVLCRGQAEELLYVPIVVGLNAPDCGPEWAENVCLRLAGHQDPTVRGNALLGLAHIARTCRILRNVRSVQAVEDGLRDPEPYVRGHAQEAKSDIEHFLEANTEQLIAELSRGLA